jgi:hypothetical protein
MVLGEALPDSHLTNFVKHAGDGQISEVLPQWLALCLSSPRFQWR